MTTTSRPDPAPDPRADAYRAALDGPPTPRHVAELTRLRLPVPATQGEASAALTTYIRAGRGLEVVS